MTKIIDLLTELTGPLEISQTEIAKATGIHQSHISRWMRHGVPKPYERVAKLIEFAKQRRLKRKPSKQTSAQEGR